MCYRSANNAMQPGLLGCTVVEDTGSVSKCDELLCDTSGILCQGLLSLPNNVSLTVENAFESLDPVLVG
jgi:hypothetical protein